MVDVGSGGGANYGVVLRETDASQPMRLGAGSAQRLSPDGQWASAILCDASEVVLYPTGAGEQNADRGTRRHELQRRRVVSRQPAAAASAGRGPRARRAATSRTSPARPGAADARGRRGLPGAGWPNPAADVARRIVAAVLRRRRPGASCRRAATRRQADRVEPRQPVGVRAARGRGTGRRSSASISPRASGRRWRRSPRKDWGPSP